MSHLRKRYALPLLAAITMMLVGVDSMAAQSPETLATSAGKPVALGTGPVSVTLAPPTAGVPLSARVANVAQGHKVYLVVRGLRTNAPPDVLYQLYLALPPGDVPKADGIHFVGSVNFFNAMSHGGSAQPDTTRFYSFDVTDLIRTLRARKSLGDSTTVTIVPSNRPSAAAKPLIGEIALVEQ
jgi:hypothetical protein